jgi:hypothetical protein
VLYRAFDAPTRILTAFDILVRVELNQHGFLLERFTRQFDAESNGYPWCPAAGGG